MAVDVLGFVVIAGCIAATIAILSDQSERRSQTIPDLLRVIDDTSIAIKRLEQQLENKQEEIGSLRKELYAPGHLPQATSMEQYIRELSELAAGHGVQVVLQKPLPSVTYPGLMEERLSYTVSGTGNAILRFLHDVEEADQWADVGYLNIRRQSPGRSVSAGANRKGDTNVTALLTFSLFSHRASDESSKTGDDDGRSPTGGKG